MALKASVLGVALVALSGCGHIQQPTAVPLVTLSYEPAWFDKPWSLTVTSSGSVSELVVGRVGSDLRSLAPLQAHELTKLQELLGELAESSAPAYLEGGSEDEVLFRISAGAAVHRLHGPHALACDPVAAPALTVWNALVQIRTPRPGCPETETCIVTCRGGSPNPSLQRTPPG